MGCQGFVFGVVDGLAGMLSCWFMAVNGIFKVPVGCVWVCRRLVVLGSGVMPGLRDVVLGSDGLPLYMSVRRYAREYGLSFEAVRSACRRGDVVLVERDGVKVVDVPATISGSWHRSRVGSSVSGEDDGLEGVEEAVRSGDLELLKAAGEVLRVRSGLLKYRREAGEVVDRSVVEGVVFDLARRERDSWLGWVDRVSVEIAGELGVDVSLVSRVLGMKVRDHLESLSDVVLRFVDD